MITNTDRGSADHLASLFTATPPPPPATQWIVSDRRDGGRDDA